MTEFPQTPRNRVRRIPDRARYEKNEIYAILDEALVCHVGIVTEGRPLVLPMLPGRLGDTLYLHGALASRLLKRIGQGEEVCVSATLMPAVGSSRHSSSGSTAMARAKPTFWRMPPDNSRG